MKRILTLFCAAAALVTGLWSCSLDISEDPVYLDLRYRVADSYTLNAISPDPFYIIVTSSMPWTITSQHPEWCIISDESGEASDYEMVRVGKGETTKVKVQYYDNDQLDDRSDVIEIQSGGWIGKKVEILQKGTAYMEVPEAAIEGGLLFTKAGGDLTIDVQSNQDWTAKVIEGDWLSIVEGASGNGNGVVKLSAKENTGEKRYATVAIYDRHGVEMYKVFFTQDGVQLDPESFEIRAGYDQPSATLSVVSNAKWTATSSGEDWFTVVNPDGHDGDGVLNLTFKANEGNSMRKGTIILKTVAASPGDAVAEKTIVVKQAYPISPVRHYMDNDEMANWKSDWANAPVWTKDVGTLFTAKARLNQGSMPFGTYTFRWSNWVGGARIRHWFCYSDSAELKVDVRPVDSKISFDFNAPGGDAAQKPAIESSYTNIDWTKPIEVTLKFDPSGAEYCHVTYLYNGVEMVSFDTSASTMCTTLWGSKINMYVGVDQSGEVPGSAILEWYEYTAPMNWDE